MHTHLNTHSENSTAQDSAHITVLEDDLGTSVVREIYSILKIDEEWSHWGSRGFDWWGHQHRQRIWSSQGFDDDGFTIYQLCAETDIVVSVDGGLSFGKPRAVYRDRLKVFGVQTPYPHTQGQRVVDLNPRSR